MSVNSDHPNEDVLPMSGNVVSFPNDTTQYLNQIKLILNEAISGLESLDHFEKFLDSDFIRVSCEECRYSLNQMQTIDVNEPEDMTHLVSINENLIALRKLILIKLGELTN